MTVTEVDGVRRDCTCPRAKHEHGSRGAYRQDRCRCIPCCRAEKRYQHSLGEPRPSVSAVGIGRRLDALATLGWTHSAIGQRLGISDQAVQQARVRETTFPDTLARFAAVYDELWNVRPPTLTVGQRISVAKCIRLAERRGYAPPMAWDDRTIDDPATKPIGVRHQEGRKAA